MEAIQLRRGVAADNFVNFRGFPAVNHQEEMGYFPSRLNNTQHYVLDVMNYVIAANKQVGRQNPSTVTTTFGSLAGLYLGGTLWYDGKIYCTPTGSTTTIAVIDPITKTVTENEFPSVDNNGTSGWIGGALHPATGKIYCGGLNSSSGQQKFLVIDPATRTTYTISGGTSSGTILGTVLGMNGKIYGMPGGGAFYRELDVSTEKVRQITATAGNQRGGVMWVDGRIYSGPTAGQDVETFNPENGDSYTITTGLGASGNKIIGSVIHPTRRIYCIPSNTGQWAVINPDNQTTSIVTSSSTMGGGCLAPNGRIYTMPNGSIQIGEMNPYNANTHRRLTTTYAGYAGATLAPNGKIYSFPNTASASGLVLELSFPELCMNFPMWLLLNSSYLNKL